MTGIEAEFGDVDPSEPVVVAFEISTEGLDESTKAQVVDAAEHGELTIVSKMTDEAPVVPLKTTSKIEQIVPDETVKVEAVDSEGTPTSTFVNASKIRVSTTVTHFSTYALAIVNDPEIVGPRQDFEAAVDRLMETYAYQIQEGDGTNFGGSNLSFEAFPVSETEGGENRFGTYQLQKSSDMQNWEDVGDPINLANGANVQILEEMIPPSDGLPVFFRVLIQTDL